MDDSPVNHLPVYVNVLDDSPVSHPPGKVLTAEHITMRNKQDTTDLNRLPQVNMLTKDDIQKSLLEYTFSPKTAEDHGTETMAQSKERKQWFDFRVSFS